jgi:hypothetical protein
MAREPARRVGAEAPSARDQNQKRARDGSDGKTGAGEGFFAAGGVPAVPAPGQQNLQERMRAELDAVRALHRKAVLLCRGDGRSGAARFSAAIPRRDAAAAAKGDAWFSAAVGPRREAAAKRSETCPSKPGATEAAHHQKEPAVKQQQAPVPHAAAPPSAAKEDARKRRRVDDEIARAREECRQQVLEAERTALPDETVYPHELEELGIAFEYAVTRTRSQALAQDLSAATC